MESRDLASACLMGSVNCGSEWQPCSAPIACFPSEHFCSTQENVVKSDGKNPPMAASMMATLQSTLTWSCMNGHSLSDCPDGQQAWRDLKMI